MKKTILSIIMLASIGLCIRAQVASHNPLDLWKNNNNRSQTNLNRSVNSILFMPGKEVDYNWDSNGNVWIYSDSIRNTYNSSGNITQKLIYYSLIPNREVFAYTANGKITSITSSEWNGLSYVNSGLSTYTYDPNENLTEYIQYSSWNGTGWSAGNKEGLTYDATNNRTQSIHQNWNGSTWDNSYKENFIWIGGQLIEQLSQSWDGTTWVNGWKASSTYLNGQLNGMTSYSWSGTSWQNASKLINMTWFQWSGFFDVNTKLTSYIEQVPNGSLWKDTIKYTGMYDPFGNPTDVLMQAKPGTTYLTFYETKDNYQYDANNNITQDITQSWIDATTGLLNSIKRDYSDYQAFNGPPCTPPQPGAISGNTTVTTATSETYSVASVTGATSYNWTLPSGWSGSSTSNSITLTVGTTSGTISVSAVNSCGTSAASTITVTTGGVPCAPAQPGTISGNTTVHAATSETYTITPVTGATSYNWTLPSGWSGNSTTNSITVTVGSTSGTISVNAVNSCGTSAPSSLAVTHGSLGSSTPQAIAAGYVHSLSICNDGTVRAWGRNIFGDLGNGTLNNSNTPIQVNTLTDVIDIAAGFHHSLALKSDGTVWAFGYNIYGALGNGTAVNSNIPIQVMSLSGITAVAAGYQYSMALKNDGTVWAWGRNERGQLGNGSHTDMYLPVQALNLTGIIAISIGDYHSLALKNDGTVWAFGWNNFGQIGVPVPTSYIPNHVSSLTGIIGISAGSDYSLALKSDGTIWSWGRNTEGQLGNGTNTNSNVPVPVSSLTNMTAISAGTGYSLGLQNDGTVKTWGTNFYGNGNGTNTASNVPVSVSSLTGVTAISAGSSFSLALKSDGTVKAWGRNSDGELGVGSFTNSNTPLQVSNLCNIIGIDEMDFDNSTVSVFPNPASGIFYIKDNPLLKDAGIKIYNIQGQLVFESTKIVSEINLSTQPKGIYFIRITNEKNNNVINRKITIQ